MAFVKYAASWKTILEQMTGNVVISEVDVLTRRTGQGREACHMGN